MDIQMNRRAFLHSLTAVAAVAGLGSCAAKTSANSQLGKLGKPASFWKPLLSDEAFGVLFHEDTERSRSSPLNDEKHKGTFVCAACYLPLFTSDMKFDSGTGWPSFFKTLPEVVATKSDRTLFTARTEYHCTRCGGHHGHLFDDGPPPTGKRYCNNGVALRFVPDTGALPALRG